ncbi:C2 domain-containing protein [Balamuthia mandrillaris]
MEQEERHVVKSIPVWTSPKRRTTLLYSSLLSVAWLAFALYCWTHFDRPLLAVALLALLALAWGSLLSAWLLYRLLSLSLWLLSLWLSLSARLLSALLVLPLLYLFRLLRLNSLALFLLELAFAFWFYLLVLVERQLRTLFYLFVTRHAATRKPYSLVNAFDPSFSGFRSSGFAPCSSPPSPSPTFCSFGDEDFAGSGGRAEDEEDENESNDASRDFNREQAFSLALASKLAYESSPVIQWVCCRPASSTDSEEEQPQAEAKEGPSSTTRNISKGDGLAGEGWGFERCTIVKYKNTKSYVAHNEDMILVAFAGTHPLNLRHLLTDLKAFLCGAGELGFVHSGFMHALGIAEDQISEEQLKDDQEVQEHHLGTQPLKGGEEDVQEREEKEERKKRTRETEAELRETAKGDAANYPKEESSVNTATREYFTSTNPPSSSSSSPTPLFPLPKSFGLPSSEFLRHLLSQPSRILLNGLNIFRRTFGWVWLRSKEPATAGTNLLLDVVDKYAPLAEFRAKQRKIVGNASAYEQVRDILFQLIDEEGGGHEGVRRRKKGSRKREIWITGHSLGGALATLFTAKLLLDYPQINKRIGGLVTFGQPRLGDIHFARFMEERLMTTKGRQRYLRFVNNNDIIPRLPLGVPPWLLRRVLRLMGVSKNVSSSLRGNLLCFVAGAHHGDGDGGIMETHYKHAGRLMYIDAGGRIIPSVTLARIALLEIVGIADIKIFKYATKESRLRFLLRLILPFFLNDHMISDYANILRLGLPVLKK